MSETLVYLAVVLVFGFAGYKLGQRDQNKRLDRMLRRGGSRYTGADLNDV
jgi:hypothetical protein